MYQKMFCPSFLNPNFVVVSLGIHLERVY